MKNLKILVSAILLFSILAGIGYALTPPPPPPPPAPQNIGLYDTSIAFFQTNTTDQNACRACHQTSGTNVSGGYNNTKGGVPTRHHNLLPEGVINPDTNQPFGCQDCHPSTPGVGNGILLDRSCTDCHNPANVFPGNAIGGNVGNLSRPHHFNTSYDDAFATVTDKNPVASRNCKFCHGSFVNNYNDGHYKPSYDTSMMITPFATFKATSLQPLSTPLYHSDGTTLENKTWGGCESCHLGTVSANNNNSIAAKGQFTGIPILDNHDSHHQTILDGFVNVSGRYGTLGGRTPGATCSWCHVIYPGETFTAVNEFTGEILPSSLEVRNSTIEQRDIVNGSFEPGTVNITINGTGCEKCHGVPTLHNIQFNYVQNGPQGFGHINNDLDCSGCHNEWLPANTFVPGALIPAVTSIVPSVIASGTVQTLTITGANFVNGAFTSTVTVDGGAPITPASITDTLITVNIPALSVGSHLIQLVKNGDTLSKPSSLTVVPGTSIATAKLTTAKGKKGGITLTITGKAFGAKPTTKAQLYVSVNHAGNQITANSISSWSDTQIVAAMNSASAGDVVTVITANSGEAKKSI